MEDAYSFVIYRIIGAIGVGRPLPCTLPKLLLQMLFGNISPSSTRQTGPPAQQFFGINVVLYYAGNIFKGKSLEEMEHICKKRPKQTMEDALLTNAEF